MVIEEIEGIVVGEKDYQEDSKIIDVISKKYGLLSIISKGCKSSKSKLKKGSSKLIYGKFFIYYNKEGLSTCIKINILNEFKQIKSDLKKVVLVSYLLNLSEQVCLQDIKEKNETFVILKSSLFKIEDNFDADAIVNIVELKYLEILGVKPFTDGCVCCGSDEVYSISANLGGFVCKKCLDSNYLFDPKTLKLIKMFYFVDIEKIKELNVSSLNKKELNMFLKEYYERYTGILLKPKKLYK